MTAISTMWSVRLLRRSGREAAQWTLSEGAAYELERLWEGLLPASAPPRPTPDRRYGGLLVSHAGVEFLLYSDHIERRDELTSEHRQDPSREIEALLLASAPQGSLPSES